MADDVYIDIVNDTTPVSQTTFNRLQRLIKADIQSQRSELKEEIIELIFPIGSKYVTQTKTNPATKIGIGTWELSEGEVLVGIKEGDTDFAEFNQKGGEKTVTLAVNNLPKHSHGLNNHTHTFSGTTSTNGKHSHSGTTRNGALGNYEYNRPAGWDGQQTRQTTNEAGDHNHTFSGTTSGSNGSTTEVGNGEPINNKQPYRVVGYVWIRIA